MIKFNTIDRLKYSLRRSFQSFRKAWKDYKDAQDIFNELDKLNKTTSAWIQACEKRKQK